MSFQERRAIANIISTLLATGLYAAYMLPRLPEGDPYAPAVFHFWGSFFLLLIPVTVVTRILVTILFMIVNTLATRVEEPDIMDERDKLVELKATRIGFYIFSLGFVVAMIALVAEQPPSAMFIILIVAGVLSEMCGELLQVYFYRRGV